MPGAWEYTRPSVLAASLTRGTVPTAWAASHRAMKLPASGKHIFLSGMPYDHARNSAVETALRGNYEWLFFIDDDVLVPENAFERLASHGLDIVSGLYYRRHTPVEPVALMETPEGRGYVDIKNPGQLLRVDMVGAGCLLIHTRVFEKVPKPWFEWLLDREDLPQKERISEDYAFCLKARRHGFDTHLDTMVQCQHVGFGKACIGKTFEPLNL